MNEKHHANGGDEQARSSARPDDRSPTTVKILPRSQYRSLRQRWDTELQVPFPLLEWQEIEAFLQKNPEALLWFLTDWDGPARINLSILTGLVKSTYDGLPFAALDVDAGLGPLHPMLEKLAVRTTNCFLCFSGGREIWRKTGPQAPRVFLEWFASLRETRGMT
jgi:hypothetical protein